MQVLRGDAIGTLLVSCHQQLQKTRHPCHARQALAPLKALLALLGNAVTVPSTFRYASTILLQQLNTRWACKPAGLAILLFCKQRSQKIALYTVACTQEARR